MSDRRIPRPTKSIVYYLQLLDRAATEFKSGGWIPKQLAVAIAGHLFMHNGPLHILGTLERDGYLLERMGRVRVIRRSQPLEVFQHSPEPKPIPATIWAQLLAAYRQSA